MLKVSVMKSSTSAKSAKIADYYKNEEKHLAIKSETLMSKAEAKALGIEAHHVIYHCPLVFIFLPAGYES